MQSAKIQPTHNEILADEISCLAAHIHAAHEQREFSWREADDGSIEFYGRLPAELAEKVISVISAINACKTNGSAEPSTAKTRRADALVSLADTGCEGYEITLHV